MLKILAALAALALPTVAMAQMPAQEPVQVMVLAVPHLDNPGRDLNNATIDPVTTPEKQAQLAWIAEDLARFRPTAIAIEFWPPDPSTMIDVGFQNFQPEWLLSRPDERVQIGYRLAALAGVDRVYAVDERDREGSPSYFPYGAVAAWAQANGRAGDLQAMGGVARRISPNSSAASEIETLGRLLAEVNAPDEPMSSGNAALYYGFLQSAQGMIFRAPS